MNGSSFNHQFMDSGTDRIPLGAGDRYYAQDLARDHRYLQGLAGRAMLGLLNGAASALVRGGTVTEGSTKGKVNVLAAVGVCKFSVEVASAAIWAVPPAVADEDVSVVVESANAVDVVLGGTLNNVATNYLKLRFKEADGGGSRTRIYESGSYAYAKEDSYEFVADATPPTDYDVLLATYVGDGATTLAITQVEPASGSGAVAGALVRRDAAGRAQFASPSADADAATRGWVRDFIYPVGCFYTQYPDASSNVDATEFPVSQRPATLFGGTWVEQWPTESIYFRTRGTLSDAGRVDGKQEDAFQLHEHTQDTTPNNRAQADAGATDAGERMAGPTTGIVADGIHDTPRTAEETRTVNRRIKVWKRTA